MTFFQLGIPSSSPGEENLKNNDGICAMLFGPLLNRILTLPTSSKRRGRYRPQLKNPISLLQVQYVNENTTIRSAV